MNDCTLKDQEIIPAWITEELIAETVDVWQPYYQQVLTREEAIEILRGFGRLADVLEA